MKTLYDISIMGHGYVETRWRCGLYRVVKELAFALAAIPEFDLEFYADDFYFASLDCVRENREISHVPLFLPTQGNYLKTQLLHIEDSMRREGVPYTYPLRIKRKLLRKIDALLKNPTPVIQPRSLDRAQVIHSTFYPFPKQTDSYPALQRFLTIYDLIAIKYPEFYENRKDHILHEIVGCIEPDDWVLAISEATKNDLCDYKKIDPARVIVTPLAADRTRFYPCDDLIKKKAVRTKYQIPDTPYLLSVCTLEPRKNLIHVIESFSQLVQSENLHDLRLVLTGNLGWDYGGILEKIEQYPPLKEKIIMTGYVEDDDMSALYSDALAFLYLSRYEGFGLPPLEAMQCGTPVITSNTSSLPEVVGDAGFMLDPDDGDGLCEKILAIYHDSNLQAQMKIKSLERSRLFTWERCAEQTVAAYRQSVVTT